MHADTVTILTAHDRRLAKLIRVDGTIEDYDHARTFDLVAVPVRDLRVLAGGLRWLLGQPSCCIVRGEIADTARTRGVRRLLHRDPDTRDEPTLVDVPRWWLALDMDGVPRPANVAAADLAACAAEAIGCLPAAFHGVSCIAQATAGHGIKPGCRLRLWFWLNRAATGDECKSWLRGTPVDLSVFNPNQPIFTAHPVFEPGLRDHLPMRMTELSGDEMVVVPPPEALAIPPVQSSPVRAASYPLNEPSGRHALAILRRAVRRVATTGEGCRHRALVREAASVARFIADGVVIESDARCALTAAAEAAGMDDPNEIARAITWGLRLSVQPIKGGQPT